MQGSFLQRPDFATAAELLYILVIGLLIAFLIYRMGALGSAVLGGAAVAAVIGISWYAFDAFGWLVDPIYPAVALDRDLSRRHAGGVPAHRAGAQPGAPRLLALHGARPWSSGSPTIPRA